MVQKRVVFDQGPLAGGTVFAEPLSIIRADEPGEVAGAFEEIETAQSQGLWLAGYASYELGYCFTSKIAPLMPIKRQMPLMQFGVFEGPQPELPGGLVSAKLSTPEPTVGFATYREKYEQAHAYIRAGDIYQVNLTFPMMAYSNATADELYRTLRRKQAVGNGALVDLGGTAILSRSPELFFQVDRDGVIETRPMKGTIRRGRNPAEDAVLREQLAASVKDRAENLMIVDLLRNDISRVAEVGSVKVPELYKIESYTTLHQMTSLVRGRLLAGVGLPEILRALFPCGSVAGAPKIRAMQIIRELEGAARDVYCGAIGWLAPDGRASFNVAIRTLLLADSGEVRLNVGGGIVYDSTAGAEYDEALLKAQFANISG